MFPSLRNSKKGLGQGSSLSNSALRTVTMGCYWRPWKYTVHSDWWDILQGKILIMKGHSSAGKEAACSAGDPGSIPRLGRSPGEGKGFPLQYSWASLVAQTVKNLCAMQDTWVQSLGWEDPPEVGMATHSRIVWRIPMDRAPWQATVHTVAESDTTKWIHTSFLPVLHLWHRYSILIRLFTQNITWKLILKSSQVTSFAVACVSSFRLLPL